MHADRHDAGHGLAFGVKLFELVDGAPQHRVGGLVL
jgi:hypothetical protein